MDENPYASPLEAEVVGVATAVVAPEVLARRLKIPAVLLMTLSALACAFDLYLLVAAAIRLPYRVQDPHIGYVGLVMNFGVITLWLAVHAAAFYGARNMLRMQNYKSARAAAVIASIPCLSPLVVLGIPLGFWLLFLLLGRGKAPAFTD